MGLRPWIGGLVLALAVPVGLPAPAHADVIHVWEFVERAEGMPGTGEPSRMLASGSLEREAGSYIGHEMTLRVDLAAAPTPDTDALLHLAMGTVVDDACVPGWELTVATHDPGEGATRDGHVVTVTRELEPDEPEWRCGWVEIVDPERGVVLDRLDGVEDMLIIVDPGDALLIRRASEARVDRGAWTGVRVRVYARDDVVRVRLKGKSKRVDVRPIELTREELGERGRVRVHLPVRMNRAKGRVKIKAFAWNAEGERIGGAARIVRLRAR